MSKQLPTIALSLIAGVAGAWLFASVIGGGKVETVSSVKESAFERVMRTGTIRCGYAAAPPLLMKDANTGAVSGIGYDVMEAMGRALSLKIEWAEEIGWAMFPAALKSGRIDAFCVGAWPSAARSREIDQTEPLSYQPYYAYVRIGDMRFDNNLGAINDPSVRLSVMDGDTSQIISRNDYPNGTMVSIVETASPDEMLHNVVANKADVAFIEPVFAADFYVNNKDKVRRVESAPLRVFGNVFFIAQGEDKLRQMLNTALAEQLSSGAVEKIIAKYEKVPGSILRVAPPYKAQQDSR